MGKKGGKTVSFGGTPNSGKSVKGAAGGDQKRVNYGSNPESFDKQTPAWQFHRRDRDHAEWGWDKLSVEDFHSLVHDKLCNFESMTWADIAKDTGDKRSGNKHHNIPIGNCSKEAQRRLAELKADDVDEVFSLRLTNTLRLFGVREGRVLRFLWHDPNHTVYPIAR